VSTSSSYCSPSACSWLVFFTLAQTALWIDKISFGAIRPLAENFPMYLAGLAVTALLEIPWLVLGWISVRREAKILFVLFSLISLGLLSMATAMFASPLYRFVMDEWSFYATMSVAAYVLLVATSALAVVCRLQFGKGLAHFLRVCADLEGEDFTPVYFPKGDDSPVDDDLDQKKLDFGSDLDIPVLRYSGAKEDRPTHERKPSRLSLFFSSSKSSSDTIKLSSTPDMFRSAMEAKTPAPIIVQPVARTSSNASSIRPKPKVTRPPNIYIGPASPDSSVLPTTSGSSMYTRTEAADVRPSQGPTAAEPTRPAPAPVRSTSLPRRGPGLPRRPSADKAAGNYF